MPPTEGHKGPPALLAQELLTLILTVQLLPAHPSIGVLGGQISAPPGSELELIEVKLAWAVPRVRQSVKLRIRCQVFHQRASGGPGPHPLRGRGLLEDKTRVPEQPWYRACWTKTRGVRYSTVGQKGDQASKLQRLGD